MKKSEFNALRAEMRAMLAERGYTPEFLKRQVDEVFNSIVSDAVKRTITEREDYIDQRIRAYIKRYITDRIDRALALVIRSAITDKLAECDYIKIEGSKTHE